MDFLSRPGCFANFRARLCGGALALTVVLLTPDPAACQIQRLPVEFPQPLFTTRGFEKRQIVLESTHSYKLFKYAPAVDLVLPPRREEHNQLTPEATLGSFYASMVAGDYTWLESCWTRESQRFNALENRRNHRTPESWKGIWKRTLGEGIRLELLARLEMHPYVMLHYRLLRRRQAPFERTTSFALDDGKWLVTQELAAHAVPSAWQQGGRIQRNGVIPWPVLRQRQEATGFPAPLFPVGPAEERNLEVETDYKFDLMRYAPPVKVRQVERSEAKYELPERTLAAHVSALRVKDEAWLLETCEQETRRVFLERKEDSKPRPFDPTAAVRSQEIGPDDVATLTHRLQTESYVILVLKIALASKDGSTEEREWLVATTLDGKGWKVVYELDADPLLRVWNLPSQRVRLADLPAVEDRSGTLQSGTKELKAPAVDAGRNPGRKPND